MVRLVKAALEAVSFRREDNVKHEVDLRPASRDIEDLSIEHYQRLGGVVNKGFFCLTQSILQLYVLWQWQYV